MTDYRIAEEIANTLVKVHNAKYKALKEINIESYRKLDILEDELRGALANFGYVLGWIYDERAKVICDSRSCMVFKVTGANIQKKINDDYKCTVGYLQDLCDMG